MASKLWQAIIDECANETATELNRVQAVRLLNWIQLHCETSEPASKKDPPSKRELDDLVLSRT